MTLTEFYADAKKAVNCAGVLETGAVAIGVLTTAQAGYITAILGAITTAVVYVSENAPRIPKHVAEHEL